MLHSLDESFSCLTNLTTLNLAGNDFVIVPAEISSLISLTSLDLTLNKIETLGDENNVVLPESLKILKMRSNRLNNINGLVHCINLEEAYLDSNRLSKIPEQISNLQKLKQLHLYLNSIDNIHQSVGSIIGLRDIDLSMNKLKKIPFSLSGLTNLSTLFAHSNHISQLPDDIFENLPNLNCILLSNNDFKTLPTSLGNLKSLYRLELSQNLLKSTSFPEFESVKLNHLDIGYNLIKSIPQQIWKQDRLVYLCLFSNKIKAIDEAISNLVNLKKLNISYNQINKLPESFSKLDQLVELNIDGNDLKSIPKIVCSLPKLKLLSANNNRIAELPDSISSLTTLTDLYISANHLTIIDNLSPLINLAELNLSHNDIEVIPDEFKHLERLAEFDISGNRLTSYTLVSLPSLVHLKILFNEISHKPEFQSHYSVVDTGNYYNDRKERAKKKKQRSSKILTEEEKRKIEELIVDDSNNIDEASPKRRKRSTTNPQPRARRSYKKFFGWAETRGRRPDMQDSLVIERNINDMDIDLLGLFDGHAGSRSADLCATILVEIVERNLAHEDTLESENLMKCLRKSVEHLHQAIVKHGYEDGTAALIGLVVHTKSLSMGQDGPSEINQPMLVLANSGDQRAVLCRGGHTIHLTKDHKPDDAEELSRIKRVGGFVSETKRVNGILALSRAVGDVDLQPFVTFEDRKSVV